MNRRKMAEIIYDYLAQEYVFSSNRRQPLWLCQEVADAILKEMEPPCQGYDANGSPVEL